MSVEQQPSRRREAAGTTSKLTAGIDWGSTQHALALVDETGLEVQRVSIDHTAAGLRRLIRCLNEAKVSAVGIERGDGPLVEALLDADLTVFVIAPNQVRNLRRRYGSAGNKDDAFDAYVLADTLRTRASAKSAGSALTCGFVLW